VKRPPYPRVPHLAPGPGATRDDLILSREACERLLEGGIHIEEKLDGANISLAIGDNGQIEVASRGGPGAIDRGNHLGRARAWAAERSDALHRLLADDRILYGEWLPTRHSVSYDSLPDLFVGFDLFEPEVGWISVHDRDERLHNAVLATPPILGEFDNIDLAAAPSVEGLILRSVHARNDVPRLAKRLAAGVPQLMDGAFGAGREENRMTDSAVST
jgi:hypothetical protein